MKKMLCGLFILAIFAPHATAAKPITVYGKHQESISITSDALKSGNEVRVTGAHFDETVGIYLAYCVLPKPGQLPTPCGGGVNKSGIGDASLWISSNPPPYGKGLAIPFGAGGRFSAKVKVTRFIGKFDCRKVACAITVRADHLMSSDRSYDIFIPVQIK